MQIKHRVRINVADRNGNQQNVLERILRLLFGDFCEVLVLTPGKSVQGVEIEQLRGEAHES